MTIGGWIHSRTPPAPPLLLHRIEQALGDRTLDDAQLISARCLDAAVDLLIPLLAREYAGRECALDLLAADALVTFAVESAPPQNVRGQAHHAMTRLAALAPDDRANACE